MTGMPRPVVWYGIYSWLNGLLHVLFAVAIFYFRANWRHILPDASEYEEAAWAMNMLCVTFACAALVFAAIYFVLPRYEGKRRWEVHLVNIVLGAGSVIFTPICLPLLVTWFGSDVKRHYGAEQPDVMVT